MSGSIIPAAPARPAAKVGAECAVWVRGDVSDSERTLHVSARDGDARCAYCHDPLASADVGVTCPGCATRLHDDCVVAARCPTLGCEHRFPAPRGGFRVDAERRAAALPPRTRGRLIAATLFGLVIPLLCFGFSEGGTARGELLPEWRGEPAAWWKFVYAPQVQRYFYPLLAWAMAALVATFFRRRAPWIRVGLTGGVVLAAAFAIAFVPLVPASMLMIMFFGLGLLGLGPFFALATYSLALRRYLAERPTDTEKDGTSREVDEGPTFKPWAIWTLLGGAGFASAIHQMNVLFSRLPLDPPDRCFVASAAARVVGAEPVRFANGRTIPVTRQLRALKATELALIALTPRLHRALRSVYDRAGPPLAARLGRTTGTVAWVLLLPAQVAGEVVLRLLFRNAGGVIERTYRSGPASGRCRARR